MSISSEGNVGIGTTTPLAKLDIQGTQGQLFSVTDNLSGSIFAVADISGVPIFDVNSSGVSYFDGNVGIGTTSPSAKLHVNSENSEGTLIISRGGNNLATNNNVGSITFPADYAGTPTNYAKIKAYANALSGVRGSLDFNVKSTSGALLTGMTVYGTSSGVNVGIGTTTPVGKLNVALPADSNGNVASWSSNQVVFTRGGTSTSQGLGFSVHDVDNSATISSLTPAVTWSDLNYRAKNHAFYSNGVTLGIYQNISGNVGIGTTSPGAKLTVSENAAALVSSITNSSSSGSGVQITAANGTNNSLQIRNYAGGELMRVQGNGNVGIGITNPAVPLDVEGKIRSNDSNSGDYLEIFCDGSVSGDSYIENTNNNIQIKSAFATSFSTSGSVAMFIKNNQNVGIGTITPGAKLDVAGIIFAGDGDKATPGYSFASDPDTGMFRDSANVLVLGVNADTRLRISNTDVLTYKPLGVNTTSITSGVTLEVAGNTLLKNSNGVGDLYLGNYATANHFRFHTNNSNTYFDMNCGDIYWRQGTSTRYTFFPTTANMTVNGTITQLSDIRNKENIVEISDCISKVQAMRGVYYNRTDFNTEVTKVGVIAQEVEAVLPELVLESPETGLKSVAYSELTSVLINAIKEQQEIIENLTTRIEQLENNN